MFIHPQILIVMKSELRLAIEKKIIENAKFEFSNQLSGFIAIAYIETYLVNCSDEQALEMLVGDLKRVAFNDGVLSVSEMI